MRERYPVIHAAQPGKNELAIKDLRADFEQMRSDMPIKYVLREDFLRAVSNMENKMEKGFDALSKK